MAKKPKASKVIPTGKQPVSGSPSTGKQPVSAPLRDLSHEVISWRVGNLDLEGPWGWGDLDGEVLRTVQGKLANFESMTINEVFGGNKNKGSKMIPVENLPDRATKRMREVRLDDLDHLCELRLGGKQRVWGFRQGEVIHILWWDPEHTVFSGH